MGSPQNASSESSSSKHEELLKPSPEKKDTKCARVQERGRINRFWFVFQFSLFFNLTLFSPLAVPILDRIGLPFSEVEETHFPLSTFNAFFSHKESRSGLHSYHTFSPHGGTLSRRKFLVFQTLYSNGFGF